MTGPAQQATTGTDAQRGHRAVERAITVVSP
jgi:hypothetical protein